MCGRSCRSNESVEIAANISGASKGGTEAILEKLYDKAKSERFPDFTLGEDDLVRF